jgi:hypothetical protein
VCPALIYYSDPMNRVEFEQLRDLSDKKIDGNIVFTNPKGARPVHVITPIAVQNSLGIDLLLQGSYNPEIRKLTIQFYVRGVGPICRFCINGRAHQNLGRTHKHDLQQEDDPGKNFPQAVARAELANLSVPALWKTICEQAHLQHDGTFELPVGGGN